MTPFKRRHIGPSQADTDHMLSTVGVKDINELIDATVPSGIRTSGSMGLPPAMEEPAYLKEIRQTASMNQVFRTYIGAGYYGTHTPGVILRNIFENPGWYTQYTPYQAEISQGRLEALLNFQTMVSDLTGMDMANASLLDEGTAASEAMTMFVNLKHKQKSEANKYVVDENCFPQTIDVLRNKALPLGIELVVADLTTYSLDDSIIGLQMQYPGADGAVTDPSPVIEKAKNAGVHVCVAADLLSLALLRPPGEMGADVVIGNTQRFGVPLGYGGPHAAYFATKEEHKRSIPGRIIGVSIGANGNTAYRMALQTREQHIRREKATSNICTAQALLAIIAGMYGVYHGPNGVRQIAQGIHAKANALADALGNLGIQAENLGWFDTVTFKVDNTQALRELAEKAGVNFHYGENTVRIALDETVDAADLAAIESIFAEHTGNSANTDWSTIAEDIRIPDSLQRKTAYMEHPVFNSYRSETEMLRYIKRLEGRDLSLTTSMIPLGSCTMKLNATTQMAPLSWPEFGGLHPFVPTDQAKGYAKVISELEEYLCNITGLHGCSLQPNSGAQGEYTGLMVIRAYHEDNGDTHRNIVLIPQSAHGTNPASAVSAGMDVIVVRCDENGNIDVDDLKARAEEHKENLAGLMVTYPSTHGVFEESIIEVCEVIHNNGGQVYMDGANMNAQVGLTNPAIIGVDVCHLNLHKTFAIPHGGGGPGMGPICTAEHLTPFLPGHGLINTGGDKAIPPVASAPWSSASILLISYAYIKLLGEEGCTDSTKFAILGANYLKERLESHYPVLYKGSNDRVAHELILDCRQFKTTAHIDAEDIAKRLMDYGFHAPTLSFPVAGTLMVEPTESESLTELDRFCDAMIAIREEIRLIEEGNSDPEDNPLVNAPHTSEVMASNEWEHGYSREEAAFPLPYLKEHKFWPPVGRVNNSYGDRNLVCTCPPIESYIGA